MPQPPPLSSSKDESDCLEHRRQHENGNLPKVRDNTSKAKSKGRRYTASSDLDTRTARSSHDSHVPDLPGNARTEELSQLLVTAT